jgi:hypothetical protein
VSDGCGEDGHDVADMISKRCPSDELLHGFAWDSRDETGAVGSVDANEHTPRTRRWCTGKTFSAHGTTRQTVLRYFLRPESQTKH